MHHNPGLTLTLSLYLTHVIVVHEKQNLKKNVNSILLVLEVHFLTGTPEFRLPVPVYREQSSLP